MMLPRAPLLAALLVAGLVFAACSPSDAVEPPSEEVVPPEPPSPPGVLIELDVADLPQGFGRTPNNLYNNIPSYLREHDDPILSSLGARSRFENTRLGEGFQNTAQDRFIFVVSITLQDEQTAVDVLGYLRTRPLTDVFNLFAPDDELFEAERLEDPPRPGDALHYFFRHGVLSEGRVTLETTTDLVILASGGTISFIQGSAPVGEGASRITSEVLALSELVSQRLAAAYQIAVAEALEES